MAEQDFIRLKEKLLEQRREILDHIRGGEENWHALHNEREPEWEEEAQKAHLTSVYEQLDEREKTQIEEIDQALTKMAGAIYGSCESCSKPISLERLEALPATRFCKRCAAKES